MSYEFPCQPNVVGSDGCLVRLVEVCAGWPRYSQIKEKKTMYKDSTLKNEKDRIKKKDNPWVHLVCKNDS